MICISKTTTMFRSLLVFVCSMCMVCAIEWYGDESELEIRWDESGYVFYCPCMGRFGNQVDYLLGALGFARGLNRTLILPPWRTDRLKGTRFDDYFQIEPIQDLHRVILARDFMEYLSRDHWPAGKRVGWCYDSGTTSEKKVKCGMKEGQPFGAFWDGLGIDFDEYVLHDIGFDDEYYDEWKRRYPAQKYPVIALKGAPARYPVEEKFAPLQRHLHWSHDIDDEAEHYVRKTFHGERFIGIHLRNDVDWTRACKHIDANTTSFMSSVQCYGYINDKTIPHEVCWPSKSLIIKTLRRFVAEFDIHHVFIATDKDPMLPLFRDLMVETKFYYLDPFRAQIDLAILTKSDLFIGNCISSFTSFVTRHRSHMMDKPCVYWGVD